jgi:hypothetical protein
VSESRKNSNPGTRRAEVTARTRGDSNGLSDIDTEYPHPESTRSLVPDPQAHNLSWSDDNGKCICWATCGEEQSRDQATA